MDKKADSKRFFSRNLLSSLARLNKKTFKEKSDSTKKVQQVPDEFRDKFRDASNRWMDRNRSLVLRQTPVWANSLIAMLMSLGAISVLGGVFIRIDEVITVGGQLKSIGGTVEVKTPAGGKVQKVFYVDGQFVEKDDLLVQFDITEPLEQQKTLKNIIELEEANLVSSLQTIQSQKESLIVQRGVVAQRLKTKSSIIADMEVLVSQGGFQRIQYLQALDEKQALEGQLFEADERISQLDLKSDQLINQSRKSINQLNNNLNKAELQLQYRNVKAPSSGIIFDPKATEQGVFGAGERILSIVPQNGLYAEVYVPNKDIGFVDKGLTTKVRVEAFPFTKYGELDASVAQIGADALPPDSVDSFYRFPVKLNLKTSYLNSNGIKIPLKSGMSVAANLKLRDKRVISILSDLLVDQTDSIRGIRQQ